MWYHFKKFILFISECFYLKLLMKFKYDLNKIYKTFLRHDYFIFKNSSKISKCFDVVILLIIY